MKPLLFDLKCEHLFFFRMKSVPSGIFRKVRFSSCIFTIVIYIMIYSTAISLAKDELH